MESKCSSENREPAGKNPRQWIRRIAWSLVVMTALLNAGCSSSAPAPAPATGPVRYVVTADETAFYKYGPAQANGADMKLKRGREVVMLERHYGYSRVQTDEGDSGYVPTDDIAPSPHQPDPTLAAVKKTGSTGGGGSHGGGGRTPVFDQPNDVALPSSQPPSDAPAPSFRY